MTHEDEKSMVEIIAEWEEKYPGLILMGNELEEKIKSFESKYNMSSERLLKLVEQDEAPDDVDIMEWKILLDFR